MTTPLASQRLLRSLSLLLPVFLILSGVAGQAAPANWTIGHRKVLIIPVRFTDCAGPSDAPGPAGKLSHWGEIANGTLTSQISAFFNAQSYGQFTLDFTVLPETDMGVSYTTYNATLNSDSASSKFTRWSEPGSFAEDARACARTAGLATATPALYDTDNYDLDIIATGFVPGQGTYATAVTHGKGIYANLFTALPHELCHNLGLSHAQGVSRATTYVPLLRNTFFDDKYGNVFDLMGFKDTNTLPLMADRDAGAYWKFALGWLTPANIATATTSGTYRVYPIDSGSLLPGLSHALRIQRDPTHTYWFEYRQAITGADARWTDSGLLVQFGSENYQAFAGNTYMLDMTPGTRGLAGGTFATMHDAPLQTGRTFSDADASIHVTPIKKAGTTPESLDVVVNIGPFPGNVAPTLALSPAAPAIAAGVTQNFVATAADADSDTLAYYWEFDDPDQPGGVAFGGNNPDTRLATGGGHAWSRAGTYLVRCTVTDMKGHQTSASSTVTVTGGSAALLTISGVVKDENGNPIAGAVVNNFNITATPAVTYDSATFAASNETADDGKYRVQIPASHVSGTRYNLSVMGQGYAYTPETLSGLTIASSSVSNIHFKRVRASRTISGSIALAGTFYDPAIHGNITVSAGGQSFIVNSTTPNWSLSIPDNTLATLTATPANPAVTLTSTFSNPTRIFADYNVFYFAASRSGYVPETGFASAGTTSNDTVGTVNIPVSMTLPAGATSWPIQQDFIYWLDPSSTAEYGVDFKMCGGFITWYGGKTPSVYNIPVKIISTGQPKNKTIVIKLGVNSSIANLGPITTYTYTINNPTPFATYLAAAFPGVTDPAIVGPAADPDSDGVPNLLEFALKGDPAFGQSRGLAATLCDSAPAVPGQNLSLAIAFRQGATFSSQPDGSQKNTSAVDGLHCAVQGSAALAAFDQPVIHKSASLTSPPGFSLPDLTGTGWEYHVFTLAPATSAPAGFLRVSVDNN